jgi:integrase/recombinase XerC
MSKLPKSKAKRLHPFARSFLGHFSPYWSKATYRSNYYTILSFHRWLDRNGLDFHQLTQAKFKSYCRRPTAESTANVAPSQRHHLRNQVARYLWWLEDHGKIKLNCAAICPKPPPRGLEYILPKPGEEFVALLRATLSPATCDCYRTAIRNFYHYLTTKSIDLKSINRCQMEGFLKHIHQSDMGPTWRRQTLCRIRIYLYWLHEHKKIEIDPVLLIKARDLPKSPILLPRPLPPECDKALQERLTQSDGIYLRGILLMRLTGIRIGELFELKLDCVKKDDSNNSFLKVELGKLKKERLVPINEKICSLIAKMKKQSELYIKRNPVGCDRDHLFNDPFGRNNKPFFLREALRNMSSDLKTQGRMHPHRLRHSYATSLLNAGMSLVGIKHLLGHRSIQMTLQYASVSQDSLVTEYNRAVATLEQQYAAMASVTVKDSATSTVTAPAPKTLSLSDLRLWLKKYADENQSSNKRQLTFLIKRIRQLESDVTRLLE